MSDLYDTLGVGKDASAADIRKAYRRRAKETHPDQGGSPEAFQAVALAHRVLGDDDARRRYDRTGDTSEAPTVDQTTQAAISLIGQMLNELVGHDLKPGFDAIETMVTVLKDDADKIKRGIADATRAAEKTEKLRKRFRRKAGAAGIDAIDRMLDDHVKSIRSSVVSMEQKGREIAQAIEIVRGYEFEVEVPPPASSSSRSPGTFIFFGNPGAPSAFEDLFEPKKGNEK